MTDLPEGFERFAARAACEGHGFLVKLHEEWLSGKNRFQEAGEILIALTAPDGALAGIGGLNIDPYTDHLRIGRIRHIYVAPEFRRQGAGRSLLERLLAHAHGRFSLLRLRTHNPEAVKLYQTLGFTVDRSVSDPSHTYMLAPLL